MGGNYEQEDDKITYGSVSHFCVKSGHKKQTFSEPMKTLSGPKVKPEWMDFFFERRPSVNPK